MKKPIGLLCACTTLILLSFPSYAQLGNIRNKLQNKLDKVKTKNENTGSTNAQTNEEEQAPATTGKTTSNGSNNKLSVNSKYFLDEDVKLIPGATFYFSDKPFGNDHEGAKTNLKSNGFVYGRLELQSQTIEEAFHLTPMWNNYFLNYSFAVVNGSEGKYAQTTNDIIILKPGDIKKTTLNFDLLPDPADASTPIGMNYEYGFDAMHVSGGPMYQIIDQSKFPDNGEYTIQVQFYFRPVDGWGKQLANESDWPGAEGAFRFSFNASDVAAIKKNFTAVNQTIKSSAFLLHAMPASWPKTSRKLADASLSPAALETMIKASLNSSGYELVKYAVANNSPGTTWIIQKNDLGIPTYQLFGENIYTIYKYEGKCYVGDVSIAKEYLGGGQYGKPYVRNVNVATSGYGTLIDCNVIK